MPEWTLGVDEAGIRLDKYLAAEGRAGSRPRAAAALERGKVFLNEREVTLADAATRLAAVRAPTLVLAGEHDRILGCEHPRRLSRMIPGAEFVVLEGLGHADTIEDPGRVVAEVRRFLGAAGA